MKGVPLRLEVGPRDLAQRPMRLNPPGQWREEKSPRSSTIEKAIPGMLQEIHEARCTQKALDSSIAASSRSPTSTRTQAALNKGGYAKMAFCGKPNANSRSRSSPMAGPPAASLKKR
jgi:prolyl-tRNA synthetase